MAPQFTHLRLRIPSLSQKNAAHPKWDVWCGRTAGAMIANYYIATRVGSFEDAKNELIENRRTDEAATSNFFYRGGSNDPEFAIPGYGLMVPVQREKSEGWSKKLPLFPKDDGARTAILAGEYLSEEEVIARCEPLIKGLEAHNPCLIWTGLSSHNGAKRLVRHLVVVSGYRVDAAGALWLHIDDPSSTSLDENGNYRKYLALEKAMESSFLGEITNAIEQVEPDMVMDDKPGRRYWLRAAALFRPNANSINSNIDFWCDHADSPGFVCRVNYDRTVSPLVDGPRNLAYPVALATEAAAGRLWSAAAKSGEPYLLSPLRTWNNGILIPATDGATEGNGVHAVGLGTVAHAWFPESEDADRGMVVIRHAIDKKSLSIVDASGGTLPEGAAWLHTLYANLVGGRDGAAHLLSRLKPEGDKPEPRRFVPAGVPAQLLAEIGDAKVTMMVRGKVQAEELDADGLIPVAGTDFHALPPPRDNAALWTEAAAALMPFHAQHRIRLRLARGESMLVGVQLTGKPWILEDNRIKVAAGWKKTGRMYRQVNGAGDKRYFPDYKSQGADFLEVEVTPDLELAPVEVFRSNGLGRAFVEVRHVATVTDNSAEIERHDHLERTYEALMKRLTADAIVNLDADDGVAHLAEVPNMSAALGYRTVRDERIGTMGRLSGGRTGVHVEMFSTENIVAESNAGGRWEVYEEAAGLDNGTVPFFLENLEGVLSAGRSKQSAGGGVTSADDPATMLSVLEADEAVDPAEWIDLSSQPDNAREFSQVVAHHRSQWHLPIVQDAANRKALEKVPDWRRNPTFTAPLGTAGLEGDTFFYFHPLRLIEWCQTGIDVWVGDLPAGHGDVSLVLEVAGGQFELLRSPGDDYYSLRLILGDAADDDEQEGEDDDDVAGTCMGKLLLDGLDTEVTTLDVVLERNEVTRLSVVQPGGEVVPSREVGSGDFGSEIWPKEISVAEGAADTIHLFGDVGGPLSGMSCSRATLLATARFNLLMPQTLKISNPEAGLEIVDVKVTGAVIEPPSGGWGSASEHELALQPTPDRYDPDGESDAELFERAGAVTVRAEFALRNADGLSNSASIELSGGDLSTPVGGSVAVRSRDIELGAKGQDVAKLQLYLSQILCGDAPCLRGEDGGPPEIDGHYGSLTARALWRFLLRYRPFGATSIVSSTAAYAMDDNPRTPEAIEAALDDLIEACGGPAVLAPLRDAIVEHYRLPNVGVSCSVTLGEPRLQSTVPELPAKWKKWNNTQRTRIVPVLDAIELIVNVEASTSAPGDLYGLPVEVELVDAAEYQVLDDGASLPSKYKTTLGVLIASGICLAPSGRLSGEKSKPRLVIRSEQGSEIADLTLGGAADVRARGTEVGLDAIVLQHWLKKAEKKKNKPYLAGSVDGEFGSGSKTAFDDFASKEFKKKDHPTYAEIVTLMRDLALMTIPASRGIGPELGVAEPAL